MSASLKSICTQEISNDNPEQNVVNYKPLIEIDDSILLYMPTGIEHALINFIYAKAKHFGCYDQLMDGLNSHQFQRSRIALSSSGWLATDIRLPTASPQLKIRENVFQFDNQKLGYLCFIETNNLPVLDIPANFTKGPEFTDLEKRNQEVLSYLIALNEDDQYEIFSLFVLSETTQSANFSWQKPTSNHQSLALPCSELTTILSAKGSDRLTLWKFAKCYRNTSELTQIFSIGGTLDAYALFHSNHGSLLNSDQANPFGGMLMILPGSSADFSREVQRHRNTHALPIFIDGKFGYAKVSRYKDYAPIFVETEVSSTFRSVIEAYNMPIWITNKQTKVYQHSWATDCCEAVAFWLLKLHPELSPYLEIDNLVQFEIQIQVNDDLQNGSDYEIKDVDISQIILDFEIVPPTIKINIPHDFIYALILPDNTADKMLLRSVLLGMAAYLRQAGRQTDLDDFRIDGMINRILKNPQAKMLLFSDATLNVKMDLRNLRDLRYIQETDISFVLDNLKNYLPSGYDIPEHIATKEDKIKLCDDLVSAIIRQLTSRLEKFDGPALLQWLIVANEKCIQVKEFREIQVPAKIACFSDMQTEINKAVDKEHNLVVTAHATRTLIEFVGLKMPLGSKVPNTDDLDELLALTNQLTQWGALSESMRFEIDDPEMGLLPSGRIGSEKSLEKETFIPYAIAKNESEIFRNIENFDKNYFRTRSSGNHTADKNSEDLDKAYQAEFGISLTAQSKIIGALVNEGFTSGKPCMVISGEDLVSILEKVTGVSVEDVTKALTLLTLLERESIGVPPKGYRATDIFPWRFNRPISYLRRPLAKIVTDGKTYYYFGYRHLAQFADNLIFLLYSSKLPNAVSDEMKSWLASASGGKGNPFREEVKAWFENNTAFEVIAHEIQMRQNASDKHLSCDNHYGDIDLLVIDHQSKIIFPIECKNILGGRNIHEMKVEMDDYLGRDGNDKKAKMRKHADRDKWLQENKSALAKLVPGTDQYTIHSLILTADEIPLSYIKNKELPLPVKSFVFLRKNGISYLI